MMKSPLGCCVPAGRRARYTAVSAPAQREGVEVDEGAKGIWRNGGLVEEGAI